MSDSPKVVLVTGVTGQDGSNMVDYLLANTNHKIYGTVRRLSVKNHVNIEHINDSRFELINMDLSDVSSINNVINQLKPDYCINFAAQSFVGESWNSPVQTFDVNALGVMRLLEAIRKYCPNCRFYSAGSSEEFGDVDYSPQDLKHPLKPRSPYGASKCAARHIVKVWRESYNLYAIHSILFNHEGPRRGIEFVTRKITHGLVKVKQEIEKNGCVSHPLEVGNIFAKRDWSDSRDFVRGVWMMLQQDKPRDYLLSSGETHSVKEFIDRACEAVGFEDLEWHIDHEVPENTCLKSGGHVILKVNKKFYRPAEVDLLLGDSTETREALGWQPQYSFADLVRNMVEHDLQLLTNK